jgi:hypothetical protein
MILDLPGCLKFDPCLPPQLPGATCEPTHVVIWRSSSVYIPPCTQAGRDAIVPPLTAFGSRRLVPSLAIGAFLPHGHRGSPLLVPVGIPLVGFRPSKTPQSRVDRRNRHFAAGKGCSPPAGPGRPWQAPARASLQLHSRRALVMQGLSSSENHDEPLAVFNSDGIIFSATRSGLHLWTGSVLAAPKFILSCSSAPHARVRGLGDGFYYTFWGTEALAIFRDASGRHARSRAGRY